MFYVAGNGAQWGKKEKKHQVPQQQISPTICQPKATMLLEGQEKCKHPFSDAWV